ncbi:N-acetylmuramidase family protein [Nitratireductor soli]|uniref:N-acetylmuramidase family protein n=1 Tax=Nitratireductor soli TaxID=1670619 RepID=UPI00065E58B0|nr:N-acetylmuramidase family protein [Nitratireductor soli]
MDTSFRGAAKRLDDIDLPRIGARIGVGEDELHAFMDVEATGSGFDNQGRPKMLFEPHVFYRNLSGAKRDRAVKAGLAYAKWKRNYPKDSYPRLLAAMKIDETAALRAASWGLGQILGENHKAVGYATPQAMVTAFMADEEHHLDAVVSFLISKKLAAKLRAHDWAGVARGYNGAGYKQNAYDTKMAAAYAKWRKIRDTPWPSDDQRDELAPRPASSPASNTKRTGGLAAVLFLVAAALAGFWDRFTTWVGSLF